MVEEKEVHLTWHYRNTDDVEYGKAQARNLQLCLEGNFQSWPIRIDIDHLRIEVGPNKIDIASLIRKILSHHKNEHPQNSTTTSAPPLLLEAAPQPPSPSIQRRTLPGTISTSNGSSSSEFVLYVGDNSATTKALFEQSVGKGEHEGLKGVEVVAALVGKKTSQASFYLKNANEVVDLIESLTSGFLVF